MNRLSYSDSLFVKIADQLPAEKRYFEKRVLEIDRASAILTTNEGMERFVKLAADIASERLAEIADRKKREGLSRPYLVAMVTDLETKRFYHTTLIFDAMVTYLQVGKSLLGTASKDDLPIESLLDAFYTQLGKDAGSALGDKSTSQGIALTQVVYHYALAHHASVGKPTYVTSHGLTEALLHTEFRDVPAEFLKLPNQTVLLEPPLTEELTILNEMSGEHKLVAVYISSKTTSGNDDAFQVVFIGEDKPITDKDYGAGSFLKNDALLHFVLIVREGVTLGELLKENTERLHSFASSDSTWEVGKTERLLRYVINTLLYITLPDAELHKEFRDPSVPKLLARLAKAPVGSPKRKKLHEEARKTDQSQVTVLGSSVKIKRGVEEEAHGHSERTGSPMSVLHVRRGHWRKQPYGPQRSLVRLLWIRPTYVGPRDAPLKFTTYSVE